MVTDFYLQTNLKNIIYLKHENDFAVLVFVLCFMVVRSDYYVRRND